jgi:segregation and condensation protein B
MAGRKAKKEEQKYDRELAELPEPLRRREFMMRVEAIIFASSKPVTRETLAALIGTDCNLDSLIADIRDELRTRPYELVAVAGGFQYRTIRRLADVIRASGVIAAPADPREGGDLSELERLVLTVVAYFQPITRMGIAEILGRPVSRDVIGALRHAGLIGAGPRSPQPGAPYTYVTTQTFLMQWGLDSLRDLPDIDRLEEAGLLGKAPLPDELRDALGLTEDGEPADIAADEHIGFVSVEE